jgi:mono/diheme cytochrome c family protein
MNPDAAQINTTARKRRVRLVGFFAALVLVAGAVVGILARFAGRDTNEQPAAAMTLEGTSAEAFFVANCVPCHELPTAGKGVNIPPDLRFEGSRVFFEWLVEFLYDSERERIRWQSEGVRSPLVMPPYKLTRSTAEALASYLSARQDETLIPPSGIDWGSSELSESAAEGRKLFEEYQCEGCHMVGGVGKEIGPSLDGVGTRLRPDFMYRWLLDPQTIVPGTPMPNKDLWEEEAQALVQYLRTLKKKKKK